MNYISVTMWVVLESNKYRKSLLYSRLCNCSFWTTIPFSTNYSSLTIRVLNVFDSHLAVFNNRYNLLYSVARNLSIINKTEMMLWLQATMPKSVLTPDHWWSNVCMARCTDNPIKCTVIYLLQIYYSMYLCIYKLSEFRNTGMEHFLTFKPFAVCTKHNYGPQLSFWQMHSHWQPYGQRLNSSQFK